MKSIIKYIFNVFQLKRVLKSVDNNNIRDLYWYDINLNKIVSINGVFKVLTWKLKNILGLIKNSQDIYQHENPKNYGVESIYHAPIELKNRELSNPTIWNYKRIISSPWYKKDKWSIFLEDNINIIKDEYFKSGLENISHPGNKLLAENGEWSSITLIGAQGLNKNIIEKFPQTMKILEKMPICKNFGFVAFSKLTAGTHIKAHTGSCNLRLRYHLGIKVPEPDFVKIRVGKKTGSWLQDKCIIFDDSYEHEVFHQGQKDRVVLIVDLWHSQLSDQEIEMLEKPIFKTFGKT